MDKDSRLKSTLVPQLVSLTGWLEVYSDLYVQLVRNPAGIGFPDQESLETITHCIQETIRIGDLDQVIREHLQWNIWRSWQAFSDKLCSNAMSYIPLLIDIDNEEHNLEGAYSLTQDCLDWFESTNQYSDSDHLRVVFSGMKGFHIEARPTQALDNRIVRKDLLLGLKEMGHNDRGASNRFLNGTIDPGHDFVRITGSFNSLKEDNALRRRKVIQFSLDDFRRLHIEDILESSQAG